MTSVRIYYINLDDGEQLVSDQLFDRWLGALSSQKRTAVQRLIHKSDQLTSLLGLRLLKQCAFDEGFTGFRLDELIYPEQGKPRWQPRHDPAQEVEDVSGFDFNISHSYGLIVVALSKTLKPGIDAEKIRPMKRLNFKMVMREEELSEIQKTPARFFDMWSIKEAVVKAADTAGLSRMRDVILIKRDGHETALLDECLWYTRSIAEEMDVHQDFAVHLATSQLADEISIKCLVIDDLLDG